MEGTTQWVLVLVGSLSNYEDDHNDDFCYLDLTEIT